MKSRIARLLVALVLLVGLVAGAGLVVALGIPGDPHPIGTPIARALPDEVVRERELAQSEAARRAGVDGRPPILFGDLHVHTTLSIDAYQMSMPNLGGRGLRPLADACDFARYCSGLDFWSINDHAEGLTPGIWEKTKQAIRDCNAVTDPDDPDVVAYLGFEWTQVGNRPDDHYGHKNVVFRDVAEDRVPSHPIAADNPHVGPGSFNTPFALRSVAWLQEVSAAQRFFDYNRYVRASEGRTVCPPGVPYPDLPSDCIPFVPTPSGLFRMLREWGGESMVIPHGNAWGLYTPPGTTWDKQLEGPMHDPDLQFLVEVFSGHGNSEEYRAWREVVTGPDGEPRCPEDRPDHVTGCQRAGEIIHDRCTVAGLAEDECERRREEARSFFARATATFNFASVPGTEARDWLDSEQCTDCFLPAFRFRPAGAPSTRPPSGTSTSPALPGGSTSASSAPATTTRHGPAPGTRRSIVPPRRSRGPASRTSRATP